MMRDIRYAIGLTLIELMVALAVAIVLAAIGVPAYNTFVSKNVLASEINGFSSQLQLARSEALKRGTHVLFCITYVDGDGDERCDAAPGTWKASQAMTVWVDEDGDSVVDAGEDLLGQMLRSPKITLSTSGSTGFEFSERGVLTSPASNIALQVAGDSTTLRCLTILPSGSVHKEKGACS